MSTQKLDIKTISKLPSFLGEADVIKSIQTLPGVSTVGEGASGFNVRGGSVGQSLVLLDEAPGIASILDIRMKEGNSKKFATQGGIGTIFSRLAIEAPIIKDKASFIVAGRRSYADVLAMIKIGSFYPVI